jgi:hypothetical protein
MQRNGCKTMGLIAATLASAFLLLWATAPFAAVTTIGTDCGSGATLVGTDLAGKVTLGDGVTTCTIVFSTTLANPPACTATNETNGGGNPIPVGTRSTTTTMVISPAYPWVPGDVISYVCVEY